jgi:hypothetical protein
MELDPQSQGMISKWNEGNLKSLRLHEAQELINISKLDPLAKIGKNQWNYRRWIYGIDILYGEGQSKYSSDEKKDIMRIKSILKKSLTTYPPMIVISFNGYDDNPQDHRIDPHNWIIIEGLIDIYEDKVKYYNDKHGLSTGNWDDDLQGL